MKNTPRRARKKKDGARAKRRVAGRIVDPSPQATQREASKPGARPEAGTVAQHEALTRGVAPAEDYRQLLAAIVGSALDATISLNEDQRIVLFNAAAEKMFGISAAEMMNQPLDRLIPPRQREVHAAHVRRFSQSGMTHFRIGEMQPVAAVRADGTEFPVEAAVSQAVVGGQKILTVIMRDVSPRLRMVEKMLEHEQAVVDFFTAAPLGLMWVTMDGRVERVNKAQLEILGRTSDEVVGAGIAGFHVDQDTVLEITRQVAQRQTVRNRRVRVRHKDGSVRHVLVDANSLWKGGKPVHSRWFVRDITDRVDLELEILAIAERERERIGQELHDDLCQQLTAIEYMNEIVGGQLEETSPKAAEALHEVSQSLRHAVEYARELARGLFPRTAMGNGGVVVALEDLAERTRKVFQRDCHFRCNAPISIEDETIGIHLFRIAQEAVVNAIKHGKSRRIDIQLNASGKDLVLSVHDDGVGLPVLPRRGKGMGLRIMQYRAGAINGSLVVQRGIDSGTDVVCTVKGVLQESSARIA